jgi:hypothetical protein
VEGRRGEERECCVTSRFRVGWSRLGASKAAGYRMTQQCCIVYI